MHRELSSHGRWGCSFLDVHSSQPEIEWQVSDQHIFFEMVSLKCVKDILLLVKTKGLWLSSNEKRNKNITNPKPMSITYKIRIFYNKKCRREGERFINFYCSIVSRALWETHTSPYKLQTQEINPALFVTWPVKSIQQQKQRALSISSVQLVQELY